MTAFKRYTIPVSGRSAGGASAPPCLRLNVTQSFSSLRDGSSVLSETKERSSASLMSDHVTAFPAKPVPGESPHRHVRIKFSRRDCMNDATHRMSNEIALRQSSATIQPGM